MPNSTTSSISEFSTIAIKDGHRGHLSHHSALDVERADRISRLAGLERVIIARNPQTPSYYASDSSGNVTPGAAAAHSCSAGTINWDVDGDSDPAVMDTWSMYGDSDFDLGLWLQNLDELVITCEPQSEPHDAFDHTAMLPLDPVTVSRDRIESYPSDDKQDIRRMFHQALYQSGDGDTNAPASLPETSAGADPPIASQYDSDCSWTEADDQKEELRGLRLLLRDLRNGSHSYVYTHPLPAYQRRQVYILANLLGMSRMSLGQGKLRRVLIAKPSLFMFELHGAIPEDYHNPDEENWMPGFIDPRIVKVSPLPYESFEPYPFANDYSHSKQPLNVARTSYKGVFTAFYLFATSLVAADAIEMINNNSDYETATLVRFPKTFSMTNDLLAENFDQLPLRLKVSELYMWQEATDHMRYPGEHNQAPDSMGINPPPLPLSQALEQASDRIIWEEAREDMGAYGVGGYSSASSMQDSDYSNMSSASKKRKRHVRVEAGYACAADCGRTFDTASLCRKHESTVKECRKSLWGAAPRPHVCTVCGKDFLYPKDLRRHQATHE